MQRMIMYNTLPPQVQDWITNLNNKKNPKNIRYNYFMMLDNLVNEVQKHVSVYNRELTYTTKSKKIKA